MPETKIFSVQPRFKYGDVSSGWALVDGIFQLGEGIPPYGSSFRDSYLAYNWFDEPMTSGVFATWVEKCQTVNWKITGGKVNAGFYANVLHEADDKSGWDHHEGVGALDFLTTDKGSMEELGRVSLKKGTLEQLQAFFREFQFSNATDVELRKLERMIAKATMGRVGSIQHLDSTRMVKVGLPDMRWRYYPEAGYAVAIPNANLIQMNSMPSGRDRYDGFGHCPLSRLLDAKSLMLGYLNYFRQEIGDLPPELAIIINNLPETTVQDSLRKYKEDKKNTGKEEYGKIWWLGNDDPASQVSMTIHQLTVPTKSFDYQFMVEWWAKMLALNTGESVGEFWLIQHSGATKAVESIQHLKSKAKGVAHYLQNKERRYNLQILPFGVTFSYDNPDDDADMQRQQILATKISNLKGLAEIGVDREDPAYSIDEIRQMAQHYEIIPPEISGEEVPTVLGAMLKQVAAENMWVVTKDGREYPLQPLLKGREQNDALVLYNRMKEAYHRNGFIRHAVNDKELTL